MIRPSFGSDDPEIPVWASYTDVAMNVLVVLVLFLVAQTVYATLASAQLSAIREMQKLMQKTVMDSLPQDLRKDVSIAQDGQLMRFRFADQVLFDKSHAELKDDGKKILRYMAQAFINDQVKSTYTLIQVEGHTDDQPIHTSLYGSNWELSSARATSVVSFLQENGLDPHILSATGYSQYRPLSAGETDDARQKNRRIEIVLVYTFQRKPGQ